MRNARWSALILVIFFAACSTSQTTLPPVDPAAGNVSATKMPVGIPREYIPPPGNCRVWYPDKTFDEQPPPERCLEILEVPAGAKLVYGGAVIKTYRIEEYVPETPGVVKYVNYFELESGRFLRREKLCP